MQMRDRFLVLNSILSEKITAAAAPLYQSIPCGNLTGYTVDIRVLPFVFAAVCRVIVTTLNPRQTQCSKQCPVYDKSRKAPHGCLQGCLEVQAGVRLQPGAMQVMAGNLAPITALVQNLIMSALFQPFEALCSEATAEIDEVDACAT